MSNLNHKKLSTFPALKWLWFIIAWISFVLGIVGAFLPILPTTPFLILAAFLFSKSSPRFHNWLMGLPKVGDAVRDWQENRVVRRKAKVLCGSMILFSVVLIWINPKILVIIKVCITLILTNVGIFVLTRKSSK
jgi:uncharacterized membrane protein YbaN (DUF454 family)